MVCQHGYVMVTYGDHAAAWIELLEQASDDFRNLTVQETVSHQPDVLGTDGKRPSEIQRETVERSSKIEKVK